MRIFGNLVAFVIGFAITPVGSAEALRAVSPLPGYTCMVLNLSEQQALDFNAHVPVRAEPSVNAPEVGWAAATVAVRDPLHVVSGFTETLFPTGATVWIASNMLRPYRDPSAKCVPSLMSNGKPGFAYPH
jgi:hypothetical protein